MDELYTDDDKLLMYLRGELDDNEQAVIEKRLQEDPGFQKMKDDLLRAQAAVWQEGRKQESEKLKNLYRNQQQPAQTRPMFMRYAAAAAIVILAGILAVFLLQKPSDPQALFADAYTLPTAPEQLAIIDSDSMQIESLRREAFANYNERKFKQAQAQFQSLLQLGATDDPDELRFFLGISQLEQGKSADAIKTFSQMTTNVEAAQWYIALAHLKTGDTESLKTTLKAIIDDPEHFYREKAMDLLEEL